MKPNPVIFRKPVPSREAPPNPTAGTVEEVRALLGPLVPALLRDSSGALDLEKIPAQNFEEFRAFLAQQATIDGISFNQWGFSSYHRSLEKPEYAPLLSALWEEKNGKSPSPIDKNLLKRFTAELAAVSPSRFVQQHLNGPGGRKRLREILADNTAFSTDLRADLQKALADQAESYGAPLQRRNIDDRLSSWNFLNLGVKESDVAAAKPYAEDILELADYHEKHHEKIHARYRQNPDSVYILSGTGPHRAAISAEEVRSHHDRLLRLEGQTDPKSRLEGHLIRFWLLAVDGRNWIRDHPLAGYEQRWRLVEKAEYFIKKSRELASESEWKRLNEELQDFLHGSREDSGNQAWHWVEHQAVGRGIDEVFSGMPLALRAPFDELLQLSDQWKYAWNMGERLRWEPLAPKTPEPENPEISQAKGQLIRGLEGAKLELWQSYKQHKFTSRLLSNASNLVGAGAIATIRRANRELDAMMDRIGKAQDKEALRAELRQLYALLKPDGALHLAFRAAEVDGIEQLIGLAQTVALMVGITLATKGIATAPVTAEALAAGGSIRNLGGVLASVRAAQATATTARVLEGGDLAAKMAHGFRTGLSLSFAENILAAGSGEARPQDDNALLWLKDGVATGAAMGTVSPLLSSASSTLGRPFLARLGQRYVGVGARGAMHFASDAGLETLEEVADQSLRRVLDGNYRGMNGDQWREIALLSTAGGGLKIGSLAEGFPAQTRSADTSSHAKPAKPSPELGELSHWITKSPAMALALPASLDVDSNHASWPYWIGSLAVLGIFDFLKGRKKTEKIPLLPTTTALATRRDGHIRGFMDSHRSDSSRSTELKRFGRELLALPPEDPARVGAIPQLTALIDQLSKEGEKMDLNSENFFDFVFGKNPFPLMHEATELYIHLLKSLPPGHPEVYAGARYLRGLNHLKANHRIEKLALQTYAELTKTRFRTQDAATRAEAKDLLQAIEDPRLPIYHRLDLAQNYFLLSQRHFGLAEVKEGNDVLASLLLDARLEPSARISLAELFSRAATLYTWNPEEDAKILEQLRLDLDHHQVYVEHKAMAIAAMARLAQLFPPEHPEALKTLGALHACLDLRQWMLRIGPVAVKAYGVLARRLPRGHPDKVRAVAKLEELSQREYSRHAYTKNPQEMSYQIHAQIQQALKKLRKESPLLRDLGDGEAEFHHTLGLVSILEDDWIEQLRFYGIRENWRSLSETFDRYSHLPSWLRKAPDTEALGELSVPEFFVPFESMKESSTPEKEAFYTNTVLWVSVTEQLETRLRFPPRSLYWVGESGIHLRMLPASLLLQTPLLIHGTDALGFKPSDRTASLDEISDQLLRGERTLFVGTKPQDVHASPVTHPYVVLIHDIYHHLLVGSVPPEWRQDQARLAKALGAIQGISMSDQELLEEWREKLVDANLPPSADLRAFFFWLHFRKPSPELTVKIREQVASAFADSPHREKILKAFEEESLEHAGD